MYEYIAALKERLNAQEKRMLRAIYEPQEVAVAPENAWRSLCVGEAGELRAYAPWERGIIRRPVRASTFVRWTVDCPGRRSSKKTRRPWDRRFEAPIPGRI